MTKLNNNNISAQSKIINHIENFGYISVDDYMKIALYDPECGYYIKNNPLGRTGDFTTAPEISQLFGMSIATWILYAWSRLKYPNKLNIIELGAGQGSMMHDILQSTKTVSNFHKSISVHIVETSPLLTKIQKEKLSYFHNISWHEILPDNLDGNTIILANEFFDALPVKQYIYDNNELLERIISFENNSFIWNKQKQEKIIYDSYYQLKTNDILEISHDTNDILNKIKNILNQNNGALMISDYGYINNNYKPSLQSVYKHSYNNIFMNIGNSDITYHVDFKNIYNSLDKKNFTHIQTQKEFLITFGIMHHYKNIISNYPDKKDEFQSQLKRLTDNINMGNIFRIMTSFYDK